MKTLNLTPLAQTRWQRTVGITTLLIIFLRALFLIGGGAWLLWLGGRLFYLVLGFALAGLAFILRRDAHPALASYAGIFIATLVWSLWEAGLDWWPLAARMDVLFIFGAMLLLPWLNRPFAPVAPVAPRVDLRRGSRLITPLKIGNRLFLCTPHQAVVALNATTGQQIWRRDLTLQPSLALQHLTCRGLSYHKATEGPAGASLATAAAAAASERSAAASVPATCNERVFMPSDDGQLLALDAATCKCCAAFGGGAGEIDLWAHMPNVLLGAYYSASPVVVTRDLLIVAGTVLDNASVNEQSGVIRAFDINTGVLVWNWDYAKPGDTAPLIGAQTDTLNSPNSWSVSSVDESLGLVYVPMGKQPPDQWGGRRSPAVERFSSSVVALDLATGQVRSVFQTVNYDLWDHDVPSQPVLVDLTVRGQAVPALVQPTKQGELFVLERRPVRRFMRSRKRQRRRERQAATARRRHNLSRRSPSRRQPFASATCGAPACSTSSRAASHFDSCGAKAGSPRRPSAAAS